MLNKVISIKSIGRLGGTFDPPHIGHFKILENVLSSGIFNKIWVMPNNIPPHKKEISTSAQDRLKMSLALISGLKNTFLSEFNFEQKNQLYPVDAIKVLKQRYAKYSFTYIIGLDVALSLKSWSNPLALLNECNFLVMPRPGYDMNELKKILLEPALIKFQDRFVISNYLLPDISSSLIKKIIIADQEWRSFVPELVYQCIMSNKIYK
jgi:nicotinate-nucleotide adenylyltransferase